MHEAPPVTLEYDLQKNTSKNKYCQHSFEIQGIPVLGQFSMKDWMSILVIDES
jgi:hypothetical protein